jgi:hypothetical protein
MRLLTIAFAALLMSGCSNLSVLADKGADGYDKVRKGAEFTLCRGLSVGDVLRAYPAGTPEGDGWWGLCKKHYAGATPPWTTQQK